MTNYKTASTRNSNRLKSYIQKLTKQPVSQLRVNEHYAHRSKIFLSVFSTSLNNVQNMDTAGKFQHVLSFTVIRTYGGLKKVLMFVVLLINSIP